MTTTKQKLKITMSERRPLSIVKDDWPVVATDEWFNGQHDFQANYVRYIRVREHADGRRVVYGAYTAGPGGVPVGFRGAEGGFLVASGDDAGTIRAIRRVGGIINADWMADACIADLPAEDVGGADDVPVTMSREGARRLLALLDEVATSGPSGIDPRYAAEITVVADELRKVLA
jgi:hypothetical protein